MMDDRMSIDGLIMEWENQAIAYDSKAKSLYPPLGTVSVGSRHFDPFLRSHILETALRGIRTGLKGDDLFAFVREERTAAVCKWNLSRGNDIVTHRSEDADEWFIGEMERQYKSREQNVNKSYPQKSHRNPLTLPSRTTIFLL